MAGMKKITIFQKNIYPFLWSAVGNKLVVVNKVRGGCYYKNGRSNTRYKSNRYEHSWPFWQGGHCDQIPGKPNHQASRCFFRSAICRATRRAEDILKREGQKRFIFKQLRSQPAVAKEVWKKLIDINIRSLPHLYQIKSSFKQSSIKMSINNIRLGMVDTGSACSLISINVI